MLTSRPTDRQAQAEKLIAIQGGDGRRRVHDKGDETSPEDGKDWTVVSEICSRTDRQAERSTHRQTYSSQCKLETVGEDGKDCGL